MARKTKLERFNEYILSKFQMYNSLFLTLPFLEIKNTSTLLPIFSDCCKSGYKDKLSPTQITESFFKSLHTSLSHKEQIGLLFSFVQFIERQVVLFDAIEDAGFSYINNMHGIGTLRYVKDEALNSNKILELKEYLNRFKVRIVLTAHPTQFYPGPVLGIITDLSKAIKSDDIDSVKALLVQLGKTRFFKKNKPSPFDEANSLIWYLENVFYYSSSQINSYLQQHVFETTEMKNCIFDFGFWPGGDRDGNPFVTPEISIKTAEKLKYSILRNYYRDLRKLKRRITFDFVDLKILKLEQKIYNTLLYPKKEKNITLEDFLKELKEIKEILINEHQSIYVDLINDIIYKVNLFGFYFASLDIRQDSRVHSSVIEKIFNYKEIKNYISNLPKGFSKLSNEKKLKILPKLKGNVPIDFFDDQIVNNTLGSIYAMKEIQKNNGEKGCNRYIISNCSSLKNILEVLALIKICNWDNPKVDIIPLFETVLDLKNAVKVMKSLYSNKEYLNHLRRRNFKQTVMLGFSDGTKDGGYFMANWSIYKAKESLSDISNEFGIHISFFDGRGGPPARGGGNTHQFYASLGKKIKADDIQLTIQGQTISSNFGTLDSSQYNLEQLLSSGISNQVFSSEKNILNKEDRYTLEKIADCSYKTYKKFKSHPKFVPYLEFMSTLKFYSKTNIGSRPSKRGKSEKLNFSDLRAIPFVGSWSQSKQNVPGFFGVGSALNYFFENGEFDKVINLYTHSSFFKTLIANSMMSLTKSFFKLTSYMKDDPEYGEFWKIIYKEYKLSKKLLLKLTGFKKLMQDQPAGRKSIKIRESIVQPLLTIQQYALKKIQDNRKSKIKDQNIEVYEKIVTRALFGNINASRNSA
ncbi:MAG: phosphoenolpyruvate carboxylase [Flavobacteriaceae bacterium]|nr:phosphoenolpyruvate carboxylase [Flavobacteriaceae bacterium]